MAPQRFSWVLVGNLLIVPYRFSCGYTAIAITYGVIEACVYFILPFLDRDCLGHEVLLYIEEIGNNC